MVSIYGIREIWNLRECIFVACATPKTLRLDPCIKIVFHLQFLRLIAHSTNDLDSFRRRKDISRITNDGNIRFTSTASLVPARTIWFLRWEICNLPSSNRSYRTLQIRSSARLYPLPWHYVRFFAESRFVRVPKRARIKDRAIMNLSSTITLYRARSKFR